MEAHTPKILGVVAIVTIALANLTSCGTTASAHPTPYCAILPDAVGLYAGNPVTQMGYQIGTIDEITPSASSVRVDFTITESRLLPNEVRAVVRSTSILADRSLELVGNYDTGPTLAAGECIPLSRSATPKSLTEIVGSANTFLNGISPTDSQNIGATIGQLNQAARGNGARIDDLLQRSASLLDNPDAVINDMASIVANLSSLSATLVQLRDPMKEILIAGTTTTADIRDAVDGGRQLAEPLPPIITMISDLETHTGDELQLTLDAVSDAVRILTPHAQGLASLLDPLPWWINNAANHVNNRQFDIAYRPPLYRIRTPNGPAVCGLMNLSNPGSCAVVAGQPYAVDMNLLQYVFMNASK
ncbi:MCE family protein [Mycobacterium koreense]|uniref:Mammalian cell entry protein n=1 Tax=Mycolicibacillus koreensis TaxID=1069220 RepID=A0A7I7SIH6_9MYCO|nr:MCE family protein [Mycolicibacillus koreensis]MCV7250095.1 MCE family protein [Mycolicibacillus koreensis]OSC26254.1 mammalian cell entry protein [Mycolicibacillus koreensis]BBY55805.1 ABC transporter substrate-binding protein [Mycolicibacillus koreensis]